MKQFILAIIVVIAGCTTTSSKDQNQEEKSTPKVQSKGYVLAISEIDNSVSVYMEDSLIFTSGTIHSSPEVDYKIDLTPFVKDGTEELKIELYNGVEPYEPQADPYWEVRYDLIIDGEIVDFVHEFGDDNGIGLVYENTYIIEEWTKINN
ncbi:hypothetical protein [Ekhidna lutea]|nr:hypothetical protein [Ekhidna lutea]